MEEEKKAIKKSIQIVYKLDCEDCGKRIEVTAKHKADAAQQLIDIGWRYRKPFGVVCYTCSLLCPDCARMAIDISS